MVRYLFGPTTLEFARNKLALPRAEGACLTFDHAGATDLRIDLHDTWSIVESRLPAGWVPDFIALWPAYGIVPPAVWDAPVPIVLLASDWNILWHQYRQLARHVELVLADATGVDAFHSAGVNAKQTLLYGCGRDDLALDTPTPSRDIDLLFVGRKNPAVQSDRMPWLKRVASLADKYRVVIRSQVYGPAYRDLNRRARIVFNRSNRGECNQRVFEATAAGALLFQEAGNREVPEVFRDREECVYYHDRDLEELLDHYLSNESERSRIAKAAQAKTGNFRFDRLWSKTVASLDLGQLKEQRKGRFGSPSSIARGCELLSTLPNLWTDPILLEPLRKAACPLADYLLGLISKPESAIDLFKRALTADPGLAAARVALAEALAASGNQEEAVATAQAALRQLTEETHLSLDGPAAGFPPRFDDFRVAWERAGCIHPHDKTGESETKRKLLRWRLHERMAAWTSDLSHAQAALEMRPDLVSSQAALGALLLEQRDYALAIPPLEAAVRADPFNPVPTKQLIAALEQGGGADRASVVRNNWNRKKRATSEGVSTLPRSTPTTSRSESSASVRTRRIVWEGGIYSSHSYARVNREICAQLLARGHEISIRPTDKRGVGEEGLSPPLAARVNAPMKERAEVWVRQSWPPILTCPDEGRFVFMQPWEYGSLPKDWVPTANRAAEVWTYSRAEQECYVSSGVSAEKVHIVPLGIDASQFHQGASPLPLSTKKQFRFLFVGGTIRRKGFDLLLEAFSQEFTANDDVCLVVKDLGAGTFYAGQTAGEQIAALRDRPSSPEIEYIVESFSIPQMASLYAACHCLVLPFRAEGFGLPLVEAMACGLPVITTNISPATDFCSQATAYLIPAERRHFSANRVGDNETVHRPWMHEPDVAKLQFLLREVYDHPVSAQEKGRAAAVQIQSGWTWERTASAIENRLTRLLS